MTLNELRVLCIRKTEKSDEDVLNNAHNFEALKGDTDYASSALNVDDAINEAVNYLIVNDKIPYKTLTISVGSSPISSISKSSYADLSNAREIRKCHFFEPDGNAFAVEFSTVSGTIFLASPVSRGTLYVFYQPVMPIIDQNSNGDSDISEFGLDETMALFVQNYAKAELHEKMEPDIAMSYRTLAMQYANLMRQDVSLPAQRRVRRVVKL